MDPALETVLGTPGILTKLAVEFGPRVMSAALVFLLFLLMALQNLGIELLPLVAGLGIAGAGIALALQGVLGNVAAGLTIIFTRPFRVGEYISIAGVEGEVRAVSLFNTTLTHADLSSVVIPNRKIAGEILHNYGEINPALLATFRERGIEIPHPPGKSARAG
jgi:small-conductance mechanosensitive channel